MAGTKGTVHLSLVGANDCSKVFHFTNNHGQRFQRGQTDTFQVAVNETKIGPIAAVKVAHSSLIETASKHCIIYSKPVNNDVPLATGKANSWYLYKITLTRLHDRHRYIDLAGKVYFY